MVIIDTSIIVDALRQTKDRESTWLFQLTKSESTIAASIISHTETYSGQSVWNNVQAKIEAELVFSGLTVLEISREISLEAGQLKSKHPNIGLIDCIIAATAIKHQSPLATLNTKLFSHIPNLKLLTR